jgi:hypothetical protein
MRRNGLIAVRILGVVCSLLVLAGLAMMWLPISAYWKPIRIPDEAEFYWPCFTLFLTLSGGLLLSLAVAAYLLLRGRRSGLFVLAGTLVAEHAYTFLPMYLGDHPKLGPSVIASWIPASLALAPQWGIGFPTWCLFILMVLSAFGLWRRADQATGSESEWSLRR